MTVTLERPAATTRLALDLTRACQAACAHCYNSSGPSGRAGAMTAGHWLSVLDQAAAIGVREVQFIGGEPTLHPALPALIGRALDHGMQVEVYSNLIHVRPPLWEVFQRPGVRLATSYYSDRADEHEQITRHRGSYARTRANIAEAVRRGIPIRAGIIHVLDGQRVGQAAAELRALGVPRIRTDRVRKLGRAAAGAGHEVGELCGNCTRGRAAIGPDGTVSGCPMSTWLPAGNVLDHPLREIIGSPEWQRIADLIPRPTRSACVPETCTPREDSCQPSPGRTATGCNPDNDGSDCAPAETEACEPAY